ncbi:Lrp/AsnC family transcriptional regulator [uncultured Shimia sp.]|uniref:Lrp/AsnC family transcriptional regulator n=1 Tax=uncultured Shimia sp. TaxID=573152 RepID=UPI00263735C5|nr:Lrp/AsnC family transcriptional regulator [uncultured Shimia sp.]
MDKIDKKITDTLQRSGRSSSAELAQIVGVSVSTANERVRRMAATGEIRGWHAHLDPTAVGAGLCCFVLVDMAYDGEAEACAALCAHDEVMELHHISGAHSYIMKLRTRDTAALQAFLATHVKSLPAVQRTETLISLEAVKESPVIPVDGLD